MIYEFFRLVAILSAIPFELIFFKRKTYYAEGAPRRPWRRGGGVLISNHHSFWDFFMTQFLVFPRKLNVVSSEIPYRTKIGAFGMRFFGGIEANRITRNMRFMDTCADLTRRGRIVLIYPEGMITPDGTLQPFKQSYIVMAHRGNAPIIPMVTDGQYKLFRRTHVMIGAPIYITDYIQTDRRTPTREELALVNGIVHEKMQALCDELAARKAGKKK